MQKYKLNVVEPWEHSGSIIGRIVRIVSPVCIVYESDSYLDFNGLKGRLLILHCRYANQLVNDQNGFELHFNGGIFLENKYDDKDEKYLKTNSHFVVIGYLERSGVATFVWTVS